MSDELFSRLSQFIGEASISGGKSCFNCKHSEQESSEPPCRGCRWGEGFDDGPLNWEAQTTN